ncbi:MAG: metal ABC transporter permease [Candidatus Gracilibacteria bacterium]|nr:metal ABC transporter permease [Candidatus Gracilibacteria bacterium]
MLEIFQYDFMQNAFIVGLILAILGPIIGVFLIIRRYTMISDTLSHTSLTGVIIGLISGYSPIIITLIYSIFSALIIEKLRLTKKLTGDMVLALFLSLNLAIVATILSLNSKVMLNISAYLFGSIALVSIEDVYIISIIGGIIFIILFFIRNSLLKTTYDEDNALSSGINTKLVNIIFIIIVAMLITLAIPITGILLLSALIILPVIVSIQISWSFKSTIIIAEIVSILSVFFGIIISYFFNISTSGMITFLLLGFFIIFFLGKKIKIILSK